MFSVNPCYDLQPASEDVEALWDEKNYQKHLINMDPERQELYETCQRLGVGITVMKAFGGGDLLNASLSPAGAALTAVQCLNYALTRPGVASVTKFLNLAKAQGSIPETVREHYQALPHHGGECIRCGACETRCPFHVSIRENMKQEAEIFGL